MDEHLVYLRSQLQIQLTGADAHIPFETSVADFPWDRAGEKLPNLDHTVWTLVWHIRACMDDVISYIRNEDYREPPFPRDTGRPQMPLQTRRNGKRLLRE